MESSFNSRRIDELNPIDLYTKLEEDRDNVVLVDVREEWEYYGDMGHVKGSTHIPLNDLQDKLHILKDHVDKQIAVICNSGHRSLYACQFLRENGIPTVFNVKGGIIGWHLSGLEVEYE